MSIDIRETFNFLFTLHLAYFFFQQHYYKCNQVYFQIMWLEIWVEHSCFLTYAEVILFDLHYIVYFIAQQEIPSGLWKSLPKLYARQEPPEFLSLGYHCLREQSALRLMLHVYALCFKPKPVKQKGDHENQ